MYIDFSWDITMMRCVRWSSCDRSFLSGDSTGRLPPDGRGFHLLRSGPHFNIKTIFPGINIRGSWDCLIFIMQIPILVRLQNLLYIGTAPDRSFVIFQILFVRHWVLYKWAKFLPDDTKPLPEPMLTYCQTLKDTFPWNFTGWNLMWNMKFYLKYEICVFSLKKKCIWKYHLQNGSYFVEAPMGQPG